MVSSPFAAEHRVALVIGNAQYNDAPLRHPAHDARAMAAALRRLDFEVIEVIDASQKDLNRAIVRFGERLRQDGVALFYYAGHGIQVGGRNYLIPVDALISSELSTRLEAVEVDRVLDQLRIGGLSIMILDACRKNPFERRFRDNDSGLAPMDVPKGGLIAYPAAPGRTAADEGQGQTGLFAQAMLKQLQAPGLSIEQVFKNVRREVAQQTRDTQIPWESSSLTRDFYFMPGAPQAKLPPPSAPKEADIQNADAEEEFEDEEADEEGEYEESEGDDDTNENSPPPAGTRSLPTPLGQVTKTEDRIIKAGAMTASGRFTTDPISGVISGEGALVWNDGNRYEGTMLAGKKHGRGVFVWSNGQRYEGEWRDDAINGQGVLQFANGDRYEGQLKNGEPHGAGAYTLKNGDRYTGEWLNGTKHGAGRLTWASGDYWEGEFRNNQQTDNGKMTIKPAAAKSSP